MSVIKPMLAATVTDINTLTYPLYSSPKIDGIRCLILNGVPVTRKLKPIPNKYIQNLLSRKDLNLFDGEIVSGNFQETTSAVMTQQGNPEFSFKVFDYIVKGSYKERFLDKSFSMPLYVERIPQTVITNSKELIQYEQECLAEGFEGVMLRRADGEDTYKFGRSTINQSYLLKLKRFVDAEANVIGFCPRMHNENKLEYDNLGYAKRSSAKAGRILTETLGAFIVKSRIFGEFTIGSGMDDCLRKKIWDNKKAYMNKVIKFKYQNHGVLNKPRFPIFLGFRKD